MPFYDLHGYFVRPDFADVLQVSGKTKHATFWPSNASYSTVIQVACLVTLSQSV
jgi:hypothetical protein